MQSSQWITDKVDKAINLMTEATNDLEQYREDNYTQMIMDGVVAIDQDLTKLQIALGLMKEGKPKNDYQF